MTTLDDVEKRLDEFSQDFNSVHFRCANLKVNDLVWLVETCRKLIAQNRVMKPALEEIRQYYDNVGEPTCEHETAEKALAEVERLEGE